MQFQSSNTNLLEQAEALVVAVIALNRQYLADAAQATYADRDYGAQIALKSLKLKGSRSTRKRRLLTLQAEIELKASRALREDEGKLIERIRTPGRPVDAERPVDIQVEVEA